MICCKRTSKTWGRYLNVALKAHIDGGTSGKVKSLTETGIEKPHIESGYSYFIFDKMVK